MPKSPTKRRPRTVASLLDGALEVFAERGFHGASIGDICDRAGLTRGAFYSNFRDKQELFLALYDAQADRLIEFLDAAAETGRTTEDPIGHLMGMLAARQEEDRRWFLISSEFVLHAARDREAARRLAEREDALCDRMAEAVGRTLAGAGRRPTLDLRELARLLIALHQGCNALRLTDEARGEAGDLHRRMLPLLIHVLSEETAPR
ncbi:TetR/AcrR family transcriptional regulator [Streptomyces sp. NPDC001339]|uniref:TetR/AcrR family transcriptional regulator n=1 Tax=Streptomyces sp. NPDC001339 TaxID=3364563 RepID=UPI0036C6C753